MKFGNLFLRFLLKRFAIVLQNAVPLHNLKTTKVSKEKLNVLRRDD